jgi:hypothetical protein
MVYLGMKVARGERGVIGEKGDLGDLFYGDAGTKLVSELMEGSTDMSKSPKPRDWLALVYEHIPGGADGYVGSSSDPNDYLVNFTDPKWAEFKKLSDVEGALKDKKAPKLHCYIGTARCTVHSVQIASGSSSGSATIKTVGLKTKYGSNTKVILHGGQ